METCVACKRFPPELFIKNPGRFVLHPSLPLLLASASDGCKFCSFLQRQLGITSANVLPQPSRVVLFSGSDPGRMNCQVTEPKPWDIEMPRHITASFQFSVEPFEGKRRPITGDTSSNETRLQIKTWLNECDARHPTCRQAPGPAAFLPTRLIDVQPLISPKLILTADLPSNHVDYIALSYARSFGVPLRPSSPVRRTTKNTLDEHLSTGIPSFRLPLTVQEGIEIAQCLKIPYIWDPTLCILQDCPLDWRSETSLIPRIFAHSYLTIAASASDNIHGGFFRHSEIHTRQDSTILKVSPPASSGENKEVQVLVMKMQQSWGASFKASPLNEQVWAMQEREFSPRIVHFTETQVLWECRSLRSTEGWPGRIVPDDEWPQFPLRLLDGLQDLHPLAYNAAVKRHDMWLKTVEYYSERSLEHGRDKLPALQSLAQAFAGDIIPYDQYIVGFWREDLLRSLSWGSRTVDHSGTVTNTRHERYVAPTWSWASVDGLLDFGYLETIDHSVFTGPDGCDPPESVRLMPKIVEVHLPRFLRPGDAPFGEVKMGAELHLRGYMVRAAFGDDCVYSNVLGQQISISMADGSRDSRGRPVAVGNLYFDVPSERFSLKPREEVLVLYVHPWMCPSMEYRFQDGGRGICAVGVALVRTGGLLQEDKHKYRRVGHVRPLSVQCFEESSEEEIVII